MTVADVAVTPLSDLDHRTQLRRAVIASTIGTTIEWYDFLLYGQMAAIVFAKLYFPSSDPLTGALQSFAVFAVGFAARPNRGCDLRPLRRPYRPQSGVDRDASLDRPIDVSCRLRPNL
jgi:hypothetical protein